MRQCGLRIDADRWDQKSQRDRRQAGAMHHSLCRLADAGSQNGKRGEFQRVEGEDAVAGYAQEAGADPSVERHLLVIDPAPLGGELEQLQLVAGEGRIYHPRDQADEGDGRETNSHIPFRHPV